MIFPNVHIDKNTAREIIKYLYFLPKINSWDVLKCAEKTKIVINTKWEIESLPFFKSIMAEDYKIGRPLNTTKKYPKGKLAL